MFKIFFTNFGYYSQDTFDTLIDAVTAGKDKGFEFQIVFNGEAVYAWTVFGGGRKIVVTAETELERDIRLMTEFAQQQDEEMRQYAIAHGTGENLYDE